MDKIIIFNPQATGSKIEKFIFGGVGEIEPHDVGQLKYYDKAVGEALLETFPFLEEKTPKEALEIKEQEKNVKCEFCEVTFKPEAKSAMEAHLKIHEPKEETEVPQLDLPVASATPVKPLKSASDRGQDELTTGPEFYGPGLTEKRATKKPVVMGG